jgi:hypothetical protein
MIRWEEHVAQMGRREMDIGYWQKLRGKTSLGKPRRRWEDKIERDLWER